MPHPRVFITGLGVISPAGPDTAALAALLAGGGSCLGPLTLFPDVLGFPVGPISSASDDALRLALARKGVTDPALRHRTHRLALAAALEAIGDGPGPDAIILGVTTGGMPETEEALLAGTDDPAAYTHHGVGTVAHFLTRIFGCRGPVITISTACSSGAAALALSLALLRSGAARRVLTGGADALCRLTCHGFHTLQLVDPKGSAPFDRRRKGMSVAEAAALLMLEAAEALPARALAELRGAGLSCDAHHPTAPLPEGDGALAAMRTALADAGLSPADVAFLHLHGTGTPDNDLAEGRAVTTLFGERRPPAASLKGALGHSLAAAGAVGAVAAVLGVRDGILPASAGFQDEDPAIGWSPETTPRHGDAAVMLSNAFGFGGNNAALVIARLDALPGPPCSASADAGSAGSSAETFRPGPNAPLVVTGCAALTGFGDLDATLARLEAYPVFFRAGGPKEIAPVSPGKAPLADAVQRIGPAVVRRLKRLPIMSLGLALAAHEDAGGPAPGAVFLGTSWGALSETHDFLKQLFETDGRFASPTDFIGSVHNAPAGRVAIHFKATGPNLTTTGGDFSFEQALMSASLLGPGLDSAPGSGTPAPFLLMGADEAHDRLTPLFDASARAAGPGLSDGGAAFVVDRTAAGLRMTCLFYAGATERGDAGDVIGELLTALGGPDTLNQRFGAILACLPAARRTDAEACLAEVLDRSGFAGPVLDIRRVVGEFASVSAVAASLAVALVRKNRMPGTGAPLDGRGLLVLNLGEGVAAVGVTP